MKIRELKAANFAPGALNNVAWQLAALRQRPCRMPPLVLFHDPNRIEDICATARTLPAHAGVVYRHFGAKDREAVAAKLREITAERQQTFLIGADPELANAVGADGVHFRRDPALTAPAKWRDLRPDWVITMAGLKSGHYHLPLTLLDAVFVSAVFPSQSPSAGPPIGLAEFTAQCAALDTSVFALGGVNVQTAPRLIGTGAAGLAAIDGFFTHTPRKEADMQTKKMDVKKEDTTNGFRFVIYDDLGEAELTLRHVRDGVFAADHTGVPKSMGGRGVGKLLVKTLVEDAVSQGYKVMPTCPFVAAMFKRNPEWAVVAA